MCTYGMQFVEPVSSDYDYSRSTRATSTPDDKQLTRSKKLYFVFELADLTIS